MYRILTLERLLKKISEVFGHADFVAVELMLERVRMTMAGSVISEESYKALRKFFDAGFWRVPERTPAQRFMIDEHEDAFHAMATWLDSFWHRAVSNDFGDIFVFCGACYGERLDQDIFFWWLSDDACDACGTCRTENVCVHCGERTLHYRIVTVPHFDGKFGFGVEWGKFLGMCDVAVCSECLAWGWPTKAVGDQVEIRESGSSHYPSLDTSTPRPESFLEVKKIRTCTKCQRKIKSGEIYVRDGKSFAHRGDCPPAEGREAP